MKKYFQLFILLLLIMVGLSLNSCSNRELVEIEELLIAETRAQSAKNKKDKEKEANTDEEENGEEADTTEDAERAKDAEGEESSEDTEGTKNAKGEKNCEANVETDNTTNPAL